MKIDIGPGGRILKRVKVEDSGQITGLDEFAGQEVVVVKSDGDVEVSHSGEDWVNVIQKLFTEHTKLAWKQYKSLRTSYLTTDQTKNFLKSLTPKTYHKAIDDVDNWVRQQTENLEKSVEKFLEQPTILPKPGALFPPFGREQAEKVEEPVESVEEPSERRKRR